MIKNLFKISLCGLLLAAHSVPQSYANDEFPEKVTSAQIWETRDSKKLYANAFVDNPSDKREVDKGAWNYMYRLSQNQTSRGSAVSGYTGTPDRMWGVESVVKVINYSSHPTSQYVFPVVTSKGSSGYDFSGNQDKDFGKYMPRYFQQLGTIGYEYLNFWLNIRLYGTLEESGAIIPEKLPGWSGQYTPWISGFSCEFSYPEHLIKDNAGKKVAYYEGMESHRPIVDDYLNRWKSQPSYPVTWSAYLTETQMNSKEGLCLEG